MDQVVPRIGDTQRAGADARLQQAVGDGVLTLAEYEERAGLVWRARTAAELEEVLADLPVDLPVTGAAPAASAPAPGGRPPRARRVVAVMSGDEMRSPVAPGQGVEAYAVMGGAVVDLRRDDLPPQVRVRAVAVMGGVEVYVPRGVSVQLTGMSLMGGRDVRVDAAEPGAPVVHVDAYALMGGVTVGHKDAGRTGDPVTAAVAVPPQTASEPWHSGGSTRLPGRRHRRGGLRRVVLGVAAVAVLAVGVPAVATADDSTVFGSTTVGTVSEPVQGGTVHVGMLFGSVKVIVPDEARVTLHGHVVFGSKESSAPGGTGPSVVVDGSGAFGSIEVVTQTQARQDADAPDD